MKKSHLLGALCVLLTAIPLHTVHAIPIHIEFEAINFGPGSILGGGAPQDPVSGSILYEAGSTTSTIDSIAAIDLTIDGYSYLLDDVGFTTTGTSLVFQCITTIPSSNCGIGPSGKDFVLKWNQVTLLPTFFSYSIQDIGDYWSTIEFAHFSITAVPIPPALWLFGSGLLGLVGMARRKKA